MGLLDPNMSNEMVMLTSQMLEAAKFWGTKVTIRLVENVNLDIYHDPDYDLKPPEELDIILDQRPNIKVLRSWNWYNEDDEILPILAYISRDNINSDQIEVLRGVRIELPYQIGLNEGTKLYKVGDARAFPPAGLYWVCRLVPVREKFENEVDTETQDPNFTYLSISKG